jgi:hypothetical protein
LEKKEEEKEKLRYRAKEKQLIELHCAQRGEKDGDRREKRSSKEPLCVRACVCVCERGGVKREGRHCMSLMNMLGKRNHTRHSPQPTSNFYSYYNWKRNRCEMKSDKILYKF